MFFSLRRKRAPSLTEHLITPNDIFFFFVENQDHLLFWPGNLWLTRMAVWWNTHFITNPLNIYYYFKLYNNRLYNNRFFSINISNCPQYSLMFFLSLSFLLPFKVKVNEHSN